jgi:hypothetical protein
MLLQRLLHILKAFLLYTKLSCRIDSLKFDSVQLDMIQ